MKRIYLILFALPMFFIGCTKDNIASTDTTDSTGTGGIDVDTTTAVDLSEYDRTVTVVFSPSGNATVSGDGNGISASISGNGVTITNSGSSKVAYQLSGSTANGYLKVYSAHGQALVLNGVSITHPTGAAINIQGPQGDPGKGKLAKIVLTGSSTLADGTTYTGTPALEDEKAALFAEGGLLIAGNGTLTVNATGKSAITSDSYVHILDGPTVYANSTAGHGIRGKNYVLVSGGTLDINTSANLCKGISSDTLVRFDGGLTTIAVSGDAGYDSETSTYSGTAGIRAGTAFAMNGGTLTITNSGRGGKGIISPGTGTFTGGVVNVSATGANYPNATDTIAAKAVRFEGNIVFRGGSVVVKCSNNEAIESKGSITVSDGTVYAYSATDDAINSKGDFTITGGRLYAHSAGNDGIDANGNCYLRGGLVYAITTKGNPEVAIDANTEQRKQLYVEGGTLIAVGGLERGATLTQTCYQVSSWSKNAWYAMTVGSETYVFKTPERGNSLILSGSAQPTLLSNPTVEGGTEIFEGMLKVDATVSDGSSVNLSQYNGGGGGGGHWK